MENLLVEKEELLLKYKAMYEKNSLIFEGKNNLHKEISALKIEMENFEYTNAKLENEIRLKKMKLSEDLKIFINENDRPDIDKLIKNCIKQKKLYLYIVFLQHIEDIFINLKSALIIKSYEGLLKNYLILSDIFHELKSNSKCLNLVNYVCEKINYWFYLILQRTSEELLTKLSFFGWPFINEKCDIDFIPENEENQIILNETASILKFLINFKLLSLKTKEQNLIQDLACVPLLNLAHKDGINMAVIPLIMPFYKRFSYHFFGTKKTNQLDKPEWYFSQLLEWVKLNSPFLTLILQSIIDQIGEAIDIQAEYMKALICIAKNKVTQDIPSVIENDALFSHLIDEAINFQKSAVSYGYEINTPSSLEPFCDTNVFLRWINIEQISATEKVNKFITSPHAWDCSTLQLTEITEAGNELKFGQSYDGVDVVGSLDSKSIDQHTIIEEENYKLPEFVNKFLILMEYYNERYEFLPNPLPKIQFLSLQIELIDDFRIRLLQLAKEKTLDDSNYADLLNHRLVPFCLLVNSFKLISQNLDKWQNTPTFLYLAFMKKVYKKWLATSIRRKDTGDVLENQDKSQEIGESSSETDNSKLVNEPGELGFYDFLMSLQNKQDENDGEGPTVAFELGEGDVKVFTESADLYQLSYDDGLNHVLDCVFEIWKSKLRPYKFNNWNNFPWKTLLVERELSNAVCNVLDPMREIMGIVRKTFEKDIFKSFWTILAQRLDTFVFINILSLNRFNDGGIAQIRFDFKHGFFTLFNTYGIIPETILKKTSDALFVLGLNRGTSLLLVENLRDLLQDALDNEPLLTEDEFNDERIFIDRLSNISGVDKDPDAVTKSLRDLGVKYLNGRQVLQLISNRIY